MEGEPGRPSAPEDIAGSFSGARCGDEPPQPLKPLTRWKPWPVRAQLQVSAPARLAPVAPEGLRRPFLIVCPPAQERSHRREDLPGGAAPQSPHVIVPRIRFPGSHEYPVFPADVERTLGFGIVRPPSCAEAVQLDPSPPPSPPESSRAIRSSPALLSPFPPG